MAKTDLNTIKSWFKNGLKPTQEQFWAWLDSFWHKDDKIPAENVEGLDAMLSSIDLSSKVENTDFERYKKEQGKQAKKDLELKANADASNIEDDNKHLWKTALDIEETFTHEEKQKLENLDVEYSEETTISFDKDRDYGSNINPLTTFTVDRTDAKHGTIVLVWFNGARIPSISNIEWNGSDKYYVPNDTGLLIFYYQKNGKILANLKQ
ncbi:hypothetical protein EDM00_08330 [Ornithobacterium rhinotracheale]|uniref:hypothetical protein n=1 Tax=Ornithobacterium rhinotracheale TaxID=28251 RepID=UPI00129C8D45|nr:hypothetical protein [Ornithobacterium rhinotracheale]MRI63992.1 hypothetical protein [Ornithobacterium rhinotracheale]